MTHLTHREINGYIHQTLTDAQRETMNRHMQSCTTCRTRVNEAERLRQQFVYELSDEIRYSRPSGDMRFDRIRPELKRRRWAIWHFNANPIVSAMGSVTAVLAAIFFILYLLGTTAIANPGPTEVEEVVSQPGMIKLFTEAWDDPAPYQSGLIASQQSALTLLATAPIYHMDLTVSDDLQRVDGRQQLRYVNNTGQTLHNLIFHLYPNLAYGSLAVYDVEVDGRPQEIKLLDDKANAQINLLKPLKPGDAVTVEMAFELTMEPLWESGDSTTPDILHLSQFHPTLAVYDATQDWDMTAPTHGLLFNSTPSFYRVHVTVPQAYQIVASGTVTQSAPLNEPANERQAFTVAAGPVDEFYMTIGDHLQLVDSQIVGETRLNSYAASPDQQTNAQESLAYAATALQQYNQILGPYPFTELDIISMPTRSSPTAATPERSFTSQGVAYSGAVLLEHSDYLAAPDGRQQMVFFQLATQWFDPALAGRRLENPWLADGLAEYATHYVVSDLAGETAVTKLNTLWQNRAQSKTRPINLPAAAYDDWDFYNMTRGQVPLFLSALANHMGAEPFNTFLADYAQTYQWGGADTAVFKALAEQHCHCELDALFEEWLVGERH